MSANNYPALFEETVPSGVFELGMTPASSSLTGFFSVVAPSEHFDNRAPLFEETIEAGGRVALQINGLGSLSGTPDLTGRTNLYASAASSLTSTGIDAKNSVKAAIAGQSSLVGQVKGFGIFTNLKTAKLSEYTIVREIQDHTEQANDNLITQFKECPNTLDLLRTALMEVDKTSVDVRQIQQFVINIEEAEGSNLDLLGTILGAGRLTSQDDIQYRAVLLSQIQIMTCDGTLNKILSALLMRYNHNLNNKSRDKVSVRTRTHNVFDVYVHDHEQITEGGGARFIQQLTPAGAQTRIITNNIQDTSEGEYFTLNNTLDEGFDFKTYDWPLANVSPMPSTVEGFLDIVGTTLTLGKVPTIEALPVDLQDNIAIRAFGSFRILRTGTYTFKLSSRDGSRMFLSGSEIVDNDDGTLGSLQETEQEQLLEAGVYPLEILFIHRTGIEELTFQYKGLDTEDVYSDVLPYSITGVSGTGSGLGLGSLDDESLAGGLVGQYNQDPNGTIGTPFGLEGSIGTLGLNEGQFLSGVITTNHANPEVLEGPITPTTNSLIPVPTFT